ncbi:hypothetical protein GCM10007385_10620 [Tateyamaria omphalii]|nr:hypothetical protein GCM10007385_10620 [Tateyamaria omphalii]
MRSGYAFTDCKFNFGLNNREATDSLKVSGLGVATCAAGLEDNRRGKLPDEFCIDCTLWLKGAEILRPECACPNIRGSFGLGPN